MQTITIDIINEKALILLEDLELLQVIRLHREKSTDSETDWSRYKGAMPKQKLADVDAQLQELRNGKPIQII